MWNIVYLGLIFNVMHSFINASIRPFPGNKLSVIQKLKYIRTESEVTNLLLKKNAKHLLSAYSLIHGDPVIFPRLSFATGRDTTVQPKVKQAKPRKRRDISKKPTPRPVEKLENYDDSQNSSASNEEHRRQYHKKMSARGASAVLRYVRTKSTYPPLPDEFTTEPTVAVTLMAMCGIAKCRKHSWVDPEPAVKESILRFKATSNIKIANKIF